MSGPDIPRNPDGHAPERPIELPTGYPAGSAEIAAGADDPREPTSQENIDWLVASGVPPLSDAIRGKRPEEGSHGESAESGEDLQLEFAEGREQAGGEESSGEDVRADAASRDLRDARIVVEVILKDLAGADGGELVREARTEVASLDQLLGLVSGQLKKGGTSTNLVVSVIVHVEMTRKAVQEAADRADGKLKEILEGVLRKLGKVGDKLLSMSLHLFPVKEWSLAGEVSALFVKGNISVTFGK